MKAGKAQPGPVELKGTLIQKKFAGGSKSDHDAVFLETEQGSFKLRRIGANAFSDPVLKKLVGKKVAAVGTITNSLFMARSVTDIS